MVIDHEKRMCHGVSNTELILYIFKVGAELQYLECCMFITTNFGRIGLWFMDIVLNYMALNPITSRCLLQSGFTNGIQDELRTEPEGC